MPKLKHLNYRTIQPVVPTSLNPSIGIVLLIDDSKCLNGLKEIGHPPDCILSYVVDTDNYITLYHTYDYMRVILMFEFVMHFFQSYKTI